jgi:phosphoglycolate phosphatase
LTFFTEKDNLKRKADEMKYKAVIFDLDGTLLNTLTDIGNSVNTGLASMGLPVHEIETYKSFIGWGREELAINALPETQRSPEQIKKLLDYINVEYGQHWADNTRPYPGVSEMLDTLTLKNVKMAILSNKPQDFTDWTVTRLLPKWHFEAVSGVRPSVPKKPDPTEARQIAMSMKIAPSQCVFLGDSEIDLETANRAGMLAVGALWGFRSREELVSSGAKTLLDHPGELIPLFFT